MTDNPKMVDLPWIDGTTRTVPEGTVYESESGLVCAARDGGYSLVANPKKDSGNQIYSHLHNSAAVRIFAEAPEPPVKVDVPTGIGAIVSTTAFPHIPFCVLTQDGWLGLLTRRAYDPSEIADRLRDGARVLFEGVDE